MKIGLILANQLFEEHPVMAEKPAHVVMIEARDVSSRRRYHQQKLALLFAGMRHFAQAIESQSLPLTYTKVQETPHFCEALQNTLQSLKATELVCVRPTDIPTELRITKLCGELKVTVTWIESPGFITPIDELDAWMKGHLKSTMETF